MLRGRGHGTHVGSVGACPQQKRRERLWEEEEEFLLHQQPLQMLPACYLGQAGKGRGAGKMRQGGEVGRERGRVRGSWELGGGGLVGKNSNK